MDTIKTGLAPLTHIQPHKETLKNGLTVVTVEMPHLHLVDLSFYVRAGLRMETEVNNGVSHFLEHMLFRGNQKFPNSLSLNREFEIIGHDLRAATQSEYTSFGFSPHLPHLERAVELFAEFFNEPTFPGLELEREIILEECLEDLNEKGENICINNLACHLLYEGNPLAWPTIGTKETIESITPETLKTYFETYYHPANMVMVASGAVSHTHILDLATRYFGAWKRQGEVVSRQFFNVVQDQKKPAVLFQDDQDSQIQLQLCFRSQSYNHPDYFALCLISRIFDDGVCSRLQRALREDRGLVYSVECRATSWSDTGTFDFDALVRPEKAERVLDILFQEIKSFVEDGPTPEELEHAKNRYDFDLELDWDDPYRQTERYGLSRLYSKEMSVEEESARMRAVTLDEVKRVAAEVLVRCGLNCIAVGPITDEFKQEVKSHIDAF